VARLLSVSLGRGVEVVINLVEAERRFRGRAEDVVERLVEEVAERAFGPLGLGVEVEEGLTFVRLRSREAGAAHLGFIERAVEELEARITSKLATPHYLSAFLSRSELGEFEVAVYEFRAEVPRPVTHALAWELARALSRLLGREAAPYGAGRVGVALVEGVRPPASFEVAVGSFEGELRLAGVSRVDLRRPRDSRYVRLLLNEAARRRLREAGMLVDGLRAYWDYSVVEGPVAVRRGLAFTSLLAEGFVPAFLVAPCLSVEAASPLSPEEAAPGMRVRRLSDGLSGVVLERLRGGACRVRLGGVELVEEVSNLVRIYGMRELEEEGLAARVLRESREMQARWRSYAGKFLRAVQGLEVAGQVLEFEEEPVMLDV